MAFRDDVVLTLVLVAALASGSTAATDAAVTHQGSFDRSPGVRGSCDDADTDVDLPDVGDLVVRHESDRVVIETGPDPWGAEGQFVGLTVATPGQWWDVDVVRWPRRLEVSLIVTPVLDAPLPECGQVLIGAVLRPCRGASAAADPATDQVTVSVPRRCLGDPRWVRVGESALLVRGEPRPTDDLGPPVPVTP